MKRYLMFSRKEIEVELWMKINSNLAYLTGVLGDDYPPIPGNFSFTMPSHINTLHERIDVANLGIITEKVFGLNYDSLDLEQIRQCNCFDALVNLVSVWLDAEGRFIHSPRPDSMSLERCLEVD